VIVTGCITEPAAFMHVSVNTVVAASVTLRMLPLVIAPMF
jgi:hypothetical protein